ncbi:uncharacterized protein LOC142177067 [Nicotiana tabacum]|uniref:Uncharacterized protein LOC142177067 n=1 Tax=Nicotiana tabacum TaxID=4097 RepID=A0AC58TWN7_TOBAC
MCNDLVISWLTNSLSKDIAHSVKYSKLDKDIWSELVERYGQTCAASVFELKKELAHISQGPLAIASNLTKSSDCGIKLMPCQLVESGLAAIVVYQFLMGLDDKYVQTRSNIFMIKPFPSVSIVYSVPLSDEKHRQVSTSPQFLPTSISFNAGVSKQEFPSRVNFNDQRPLTCKYCKKPGHTIDKCYKLHEYPPNFKFTKGPGSRKIVTHIKVNFLGLPANVASNMVLSLSIHMSLVMFQ